MDNENLRKIAQGHGWPEDEFAGEVEGMMKDYGFPEDKALAAVQRHFTQKYGMKKIDNPGPAKKTENSGPAMSIPVKVGGQAWHDITLWPPRPDAPETWKRRAGVTVTKKVQDQQTKEVKTTETMHLTPNQALMVGATLTQVGFAGKRLDAEA